MNLKTTVWSEGDWGLWRHDISESNIGIWGKYMLFHNHYLYNHRVKHRYDGTYTCLYCDHEAPNGAVALLKLMNWEDT